MRRRVSGTVDPKILLFNPTLPNGFSLLGSSIFVQASMPATRADGSALVSNDQWYETDRRIWWVYNSTLGSWLSQQIFEMTAQTTATVSGNSYLFAPQFTSWDNYGLYVRECLISCFVATNTAANYWTLGFHRLYSSSGTNSTIASFSTASSTAAQWNLFRTNVNTKFTPFSTDDRIWYVGMATTGSPGAFYGSFTITYQWVHP